MSPTKLREEYRKHNPDGHFFDDATMEHWGDTMQNFGVNDDGEFWELYRKQPVKGGLQSSHYFHKQTFKHTPRY